MNTRVNFFFEQGDQGWQELYWRSDDPNLITSLEQATFLAKNRQLFLNRDAELIAIRVSDEDVTRDSLISNIRGVYPRSKAVALLTPDQPWVAVLERLEAGSLYRRQLYLRGGVKGVYSATLTKPDLNNPWGRLVQKYNDILRNQANGWKFRVTLRGADSPKVGIVAVVKGVGPPPFLTCTAPGLVTATGDKVRLSGFKTSTGTLKDIGGIYYVSLGGTGTFTVDLSVAPTGTYAGDGVVTPLKPAYRSITSADAIRVVRHKVGLTYGGFKGRIKGATV